MEVRKGFKQTEVGVIPEDWDVVPMGSLGTFSKGMGIKKDEAKSGEIPCVRYGEIYTHHNDIVREFNSWISPEVAKTSRRLKKGELLFAGSGETKEEIGKCVAFISSVEAYAGGDVVILTPNKGVSKFFGYLFNAPIIAKQKASKGQGDAIVHISATALSSIRIPLPPTLAEQEAIAEALSDADALIESLETLLAKKRQVKQGAMSELLSGKKRLPGFDGEWVEKTLGEIGEITGAGVDKKIRPNESPVRLVNYLDVYHKDFIYSEHLNHWVSAPSAQLKRCAVRTGDVFFTPSSEMPYDIAVSAVAMEDIPDAAYSYHVVRLRLNEDNDWNLAFRTYTFKTNYFLSQAETMCEGSGKRYVITLRRFRELRVYYPTDLKEQTAIAEILSDMDAEIRAVEEKLSKARAVKAGMMSELLGGKIRLVESE